MPSEFTREQVTAVAALANLELAPEEVDLFARQLAEILAYADEVQKVDTTGVPPTAAVISRPSAGRPDERKPCLPVEDVLANAPDADRIGGFFKVPQVIG
jgi:aspartyl-tRNA(Asn)/glutamyl-tRNA(Gln) amidotransferase subunit C